MLLKTIILLGLCNVIYRLIFKTIINRLKPYMSSIIPDYQIAFVEKAYYDNFIICFEAFHFMNFGKINDSSHFTLKLYLSNIVNSVERNYLESVKLAMNFPKNLVVLIMDVFIQFVFSVLINGNPSQPFTTSRGIRQGDPFSPYLFVIFAEGFGKGWLILWFVL